MSNFSKKRIAIIVIGIVVFAAIIVPIAYYATRSHKREDKTPTSAPKPAALNLSEFVNCVPEADGGVVKVSKELCEKRSCVYYVDDGNGKAACVFKSRKDFGFSVKGDKKLITTSYGYKVYLEPKGTPPFDSPAFKNPYFEVEMREENLIRFKFDDEGNARYKVPKVMNMSQKKSSNQMYTFTITDWKNFAFKISRKSTGTILFDTSVGGLTLTNQFLQLSTKLPSKNIYGFGENLHHSFRHDLNHQSWPMFSRDQPPRHKAKANLYGVHPFYTCVEEDGNAHGVLLLNSNAQDYSFTPLPMLSYRTIGGILDLYMFLGPSPENVVQQYTKAIGRPFMPPYWSFGFSLSRYGYNSLENLEAAIKRTQEHGIPQDVQYADIDHMNNSMDFTINMDTFAGLNGTFTKLREGGMRTVIMLDPCFISNVTDYEPYEQLSKISGAVMWPDGEGKLGDNKDKTGAILGYVWPQGKTVFPDFFKNKTRSLWTNLIKEHRKKLIFDGLWIDMNEPANFGTNQPRPFNWPENVHPYWSLKCPNSELDDPPYRTMAAYIHDMDNKVESRLSNKTLCMVARQGSSNELLHYNVHSLFGWSQSEPTLQALRSSSGERSMVLSRSTFPGSGRFVGHWLGDNDSKWPDLADSVIGMLEFNLFGIPFIGADICGFFGNATAELCKRWSQLGAFYPFSRNHNGIGYNDQDPGNFGSDVANATREALETRYWLLPYLYTLFHSAHVDGNTVVRPLHHEFPTDPTALGVDKQFLWGKSLLISPILEQGQTKLNYYLPAGRWYDFYKGTYTSGPTNITMAVDADTPIRLHVRGGSILPMQKPARNTTFSRKNAMKLLITLDADDSGGGTASGTLFWDDGVSTDTYEKSDYSLFTFSVENKRLRMRIIHNRTDIVKGLVIDVVQIHGVHTSVDTVELEDSDKVFHENFHYNEKTQTLLIENLTLSLEQEFSLTWADEKIDCYPEELGPVKSLTEERCRNRSCVYRPSTSPSPDCFYPKAGYGYKAGDIVTEEQGWSVNLTWKGIAPFEDAVKNITFSLEMIDNNVLRFKLDDPNAQRYKVPLQLKRSGNTASDPRYEVVVTNKDPFAFQIIRRSTGTVLWDTSVGGLTFEDQFLQIATKLPSQNVYGFGENVHGSLRHNLEWQTWPMFARDEPTGGENFNNHYGVHPYYMCTEDDGHSHGVLLLNSNAQEYSFTPLPMLVYRTIGGIFDFYMFLGPEPENVVQQYTAAIGRPYMPPYWSLGFQLCRYGYNNLQNLKAAVERTKNAGIPQDVQYADIDHMDRQKIFTVDTVNFSGLKEYFDEIRSQGMKTIIILDPCMAANDTYKPYVEMRDNDGNIKWPKGYPIPANSSVHNGTLLGYVWPDEKVVFPDFFKTSTKRVWESLIEEHYENQLMFNGLWIDMNEPANFGTNLKTPWNWPKNRPPWSLECTTGDKYEDPPYRPMAAFLYDNVNHTNRISDKTICMVARQGNNDEYRHYDVHSLYGWSQTKPTLDGLRNATGKRGIVVTRSTFPGSGQYAGHWLGDNNADWDNPRLSVIGILESNMFGIPYIGADVCGFFSNTTADLCKRWMQLGAFYTFYRNHNGIGYIDQDPASFTEEVTRVSREAVLTRYWILPYLYTLFHHAHVRGNTVIRPLHHEFPTDSRTWGIDRQFLWGPALLISPILDMEPTMSMYLPQGTWYDFYTGEKLTTEGKMNKTLNVGPETKIPLHIRGGHILPMQKPSNNTYFSRQNNMTLKVALQSDDRRTSAEGDLFWDDGESIGTYDSKQYHYIKFLSTDTSLTLKVHHNYPEVVSGIFIENIHILGLHKYASTAEIKFLYIDDTEHGSFEYHASNGTLMVSKLALGLDKDVRIEWGPRKRLTDHTLPKIDCFPDIDTSKEAEARRQCTERGCLWNTDTDDGSPHCYTDNKKHGYTMTRNLHKTSQTDVTEVALRWKNVSSMFKNDIVNVKLKIIYVTENILRLKFVDADSERYEVPVPLNNVTREQDFNNYIVEYDNDVNDVFYLRVKRNGTNTTIWDTSIGGLTYSKQFLQIAIKVPSKNMYGLGENRHLTFRHDFNYKTWPFFSRDNGVNGGDYANLYGVHPYYMNVEDNKGNAHSVLLLNSNAMEVVLQPTPAITYRTIGGVLDFYIFLGPEPETVAQQYTSVIGHTYLPPYWSLGFQLCKYGYNSLENLRAAFQRTVDADIPFDVQYADIDHMDERMDFTWDPVNFKDLPQFIKELHEKGMRFISILDPALISNVTNYPPYDKGIEKDVFIKWPEGKKPDYADHKRNDMYGYVWPKGKVVFPDFLKPDTREYWKDLIVNHYKNLSFDGLWIDMNEPANFGTNEDKPFNWPADVKPYWSLKCPSSNLDDPPYKPKAVYGQRLSDKTLCMVALQNDGKYHHYDVHSLYGWSETEPTLYALREASKNTRRGIVISRSTYPSSGRHAGHWLGDNDSKWSNLHDSVIGIMEFNLFGIAYTGADICGFFGDSNAELCQRWMQLGAFYTFSRNHNAINQKPQDPASFGPAVADSSKRALKIRYYLLPYLYTLFYHAHKEGGTVIRSLLHNFPDDFETFNIDSQFMWGSGFMIAPVLERGKIKRDVYYPRSVWYDYYTGEQIKESGTWYTVNAPRDFIPLFIRGGYILPVQTPANTTKHSRLNTMGLVIALDGNGTANGDLFWDDGESIDTIFNRNYTYAMFNFENMTLRTRIEGGDGIVDALKFDMLTIYGINKTPTSIECDGSPVSFDNFTYNKNINTLHITGIQHPLNQNFTVTIKT